VFHPDGHGVEVEVAVAQRVAELPLDHRWQSGPEPGML
jgi:hypothetical protein